MSWVIAEEEGNFRCVFTIFNFSETTSVEVNAEDAVISSGAKSELMLPHSMVDTLDLKPTEITLKSNGTTITKTVYRPIRLEAKFMLGEVEVTRIGYVDVKVFDNDISAESIAGREETASVEVGKRKRESEGSAIARDGFITVPLCEYRPVSDTSQRVILGAAALRKLYFYLSIPNRCLYVEEGEHIDED